MIPSRFKVGLLGLWVASASAAAVPQVQSRQQANCQDPAHGLDPSCWATLSLTQYVTDWAQANAQACGTEKFLALLPEL
jgi:hypothetical protein